MADSQGPGKHKPKACTTVGIQDLADCDGFQDPGRGLYALELTDGGLYKRSQIPTPNVKEPDWDIMLLMQQPFIHLKKFVVRKLENAGKLLISYIPPSPNIEIKGEAGVYHLSSDAVDGGLIEAKTVYKRDLDALSTLPENSTIYLEVLLGDPPAPHIAIPIIKGFALKWIAADKGKTVGCVLRIRKDKSPLVSATLISVLPLVEPGVSLQSIRVGKQLGLLKLYYSMIPVEDSIIEAFTKKTLTAFDVQN